jgi:hypothetical protein
VVAKYEFVQGDEILVHGRRLRRIRRLSDGVVGGYIESEANLSQTGDCFAHRDSRVYETAKVLDNAQVYGEVFGSASISGEATLRGRAYGFAVIGDQAEVFGEVFDKAQITGNGRVYGRAYGNARVTDSAVVYGDISGSTVAAGNHHLYGKS